MHDYTKIFSYIRENPFTSPQPHDIHHATKTETHPLRNTSLKSDPAYDPIYRTSPEQNMWLYSLMLAIISAPQDTREGHKDKAWIVSDRDAIGSYIWICNELNIDHLKYRNLVIHNPELIPTKNVCISKNVFHCGDPEQSYNREWQKRKRIKNRLARTKNRP